MTGTERTIDWNGRCLRAWVPEPLGAWTPVLTKATVQRAERAAQAARRAGAIAAPDTRALARADAIASSRIEGVTAPSEQITAAELEPNARGDAAWIADNVAATLQAIADAHARALDTATLHSWHRLLMARASGLPEHQIGAYRLQIGWIGGTSPLDAVAVLPPPETIVALTDDLIAFANRTDLDPVAHAAVAHAQFESIHPYADGNGRVGRILIAWLLTRRLRLRAPLPLSAAIAADTGGYLSGLALYRLGQLDPYVAWFAEKLERASQLAGEQLATHVHRTR
jgi:Fic family protein